MYMNCGEMTKLGISLWNHIIPYIPQKPCNLMNFEFPSKINAH